VTVLDLVRVAGSAGDALTSRWGGVLFVAMATLKPHRLARAARVPRALARAVRDGAERMVHALRRAAVRRRLDQVRKPASVLFICHGNICRSPYAAEVLAHRLVLRGRNNGRVRSAGFVGPDRPSPAEAIAVAALRGHDLRGHRSRLLETVELRETDVIVVMDAGQQRAIARMAGRPRSEIVVLGDLDPGRIERRGIRDPWGEPAGVFEEVYARIDRCVEELARALGG
ncbi:MAG TPA: hypothetical protein VM778_12145, partial [Gemmatimonadota bacterium]|nr:hypothetical protein [Gemmatimonadota bacterium]